MSCGVQKFKNRFRLNTQIPIALIRSIRLVSVIQMNIDTHSHSELCSIESNQERSIGLKNPHSRLPILKLDYYMYMYIYIALFLFIWETDFSDGCQLDVIPYQIWK